MEKTVANAKENDLRNRKNINGKGKDFLYKKIKIQIFLWIYLFF